MTNMETAIAGTTRDRSRDGFTRATLVGSLAADPVSRRTRAGDVTSLRLAVNETADPGFFDVVLWDKVAEIAATNLSTGARVLVTAACSSGVGRTAPDPGTRRLRWSPTRSGSWADGETMSDDRRLAVRGVVYRSGWVAMPNALPAQ